MNKQTRCILDLQIVDLGDRMIGGDKKINEVAKVITFILGYLINWFT